MSKQPRFFTAKNIAYLAVFTALVALLQVFGGAIKIGSTSLSFVLVPIVLGAILLGPWAGAFLGFVFGLITYLYGVTGADFFTSVLFQSHPFLTALTCFGKGIGAGLLSGIAYRLIARKNQTVAVFTASALAPIVNTGLFILGALTMSDTLTANFVAEGSTLVYFLFIGCAGINFLVELGINLLLSPAIVRVEKIVNRQIRVRKQKNQPKTDENGGEAI